MRPQHQLRGYHASVSLENITFKPLLVIAEDFDHAAHIFMHSLMTGLRERPDADFDVTK
jgi:hypothetical protein